MMENARMRSFQICAAVAATIVAAGVAIFLSRALATRVRSFATYAEAREDNFKHGYLPDFFPESATDISVSSTIDPSFVQLRFKFSGADMEEMTRSLREVANAERSNLLASVSNLRLAPDLGDDLRVFVDEPHSEGTKRPRQVLVIDPERSMAWYFFD